MNAEKKLQFSMLKFWQSAFATLLAMAIIICSFFSTAALAEEVLQIEINKGKMVKLPAAASSVVVSDPATADVQVVSPTLLFVHGKKIGDTSIYAVDSSDSQIYSATISVTHNLSKLMRAVKQIAPDSDVTARTMDGGIMLNGSADSLAESENIRNIASAFLGNNEKMINMIKSAGSDQVALKVKIVEMSRNDLKVFGVNLQSFTTNGLFGMQLLQGSNILFHTDDPDTQALRAYNSTVYRGTSTNSNLFLRYNDVSGLIDALETNGLATILAEPVLTTTSGTTASFLAGGEFPIPTIGQNNTVTIEYKPFGVSLNFTPTVMSKSRISIDVAPEVSSLNFSNPIEVSGYTYPVVESRKAKSVIELGSGDTFMLAGLLKNDGSNNVEKFPGLGDLPVLGTLFRSNRFQNNQTELVILVTPYLVNPVSDPKKMQTPADGYIPPSDLQRLLLGSLYQQQDFNSADSAQKEQLEKIENNMPKLHGQGGFVYE